MGELEGELLSELLPLSLLHDFLLLPPPLLLPTLAPVSEVPTQHEACVAGFDSHDDDAPPPAKSPPP